MEGYPLPKATIPGGPHRPGGLLRSVGETLKKLGSEWEWKFHEERVTIRGHLWFDQYTQKGGDAVDFFRYFYGESEEQATACC